jgi:hypothetical protein
MTSSTNSNRKISRRKCSRTSADEIQPYLPPYFYFFGNGLGIFATGNGARNGLQPAGITVQIINQVKYFTPDKKAFARV